MAKRKKKGHESLRERAHHKHKRDATAVYVSIVVVIIVAVIAGVVMHSAGAPIRYDEETAKKAAAAQRAATSGEAVPVPVAGKLTFKESVIPVAPVKTSANRPGKPPAKRSAALTPSAPPSAAEWKALDNLPNNVAVLENCTIDTPAGSSTRNLTHYSASQDVKLVVKPVTGNAITVWRKLSRGASANYLKKIYFFVPIPGQQLYGFMEGGTLKLKHAINLISTGDEYKNPAERPVTLTIPFKDVGGGVAYSIINLGNLFSPNPTSERYIPRPFIIYFFVRGNDKDFTYPTPGIKYLNLEDFFVTASNVATFKVK